MLVQYCKFIYFGIRQLTSDETHNLEISFYGLHNPLIVFGNIDLMMSKTFSRVY